MARARNKRSETVEEHDSRVIKEIVQSAQTWREAKSRINDLMENNCCERPITSKALLREVITDEKLQWPVNW